MPSEREKMLAGELYLAADLELVTLRRTARRMTRRFNATTEDEADVRLEILRTLLGSCGPRLEIEPPFRCDYGFNISAGDNFYMNFDGVILDCAPVTIGENVLCGPGVHIYAATHPLGPEARSTGLESAQPVTIGDRVWLGGRVIVCPGVTIGDDSVIAAGSVVTRDVPAGVLAGGNPCRIIRPLTPG
ncbi:sugar O-acetyltransferase [Nannocystis punicea]|uniref:Sugar O-acetyltransferase n=1 Tax=Nannocystis punicea TaxID=2995304 RepID=A0ABY7GV45_9BACT|nr:sugar O-acetyltransferase [Nannocystis poenicansa]WAS90812.1 sugar O-acetyltransferase [Nannocystis poenicansa]